MSRASSIVTEQEFLDMLITDTGTRRCLAHLLGWSTAHFRPAQTGRGWRTAIAGDGMGFPDLILAKTFGDGGRTIFAEIKKEGEKPSPKQREWLDLLYDTGNEVYLWYHSDLDEIGKILMLDAAPIPRRKVFQSSWGNRR